MYLRREYVPIETTTGASVIGHTRVLNGMIHALHYVRSTAAPISSTATVAIASAMQGILARVIGGASFVAHPRVKVFFDSTGGDVSALGTTGGGVHLDKFAAVEERLTVTVAASSAAGQVGSFYVDVIGG